MLSLLAGRRPSPAGGGLGVAYRLVESIRTDPDLVAGFDRCFLLAGNAIIDVFEEFDDGGQPDAPDSGTDHRMGSFARWLKQGANLIQISRSADQVVGLCLNPLLSSRFVRGLRPNVALVHTEHSKGGNHTEDFALHGRRTIRGVLRKMAAKEYIRQAHAVVFPSDGALLLYRAKNPWWDVGAGGQLTRVIHNGIQTPDVDTDVRGTSSRYRIVNVAAHVPEKGIDLLLQSVAILRSRSAMRIEVVNVGATSSFTVRLMALTRALNLTDCVEFRGPLSHAETLREIAGADAFVLLPSVAVFDIALLEAMALGTPVVSTPVGGNLEALGSGYPLYCDSAEGAAKTLGVLIQDPKKARAIGLAGQARFSRLFTARRMAQNYFALCHEVLDIL